MKPEMVILKMLTGIYGGATTVKPKSQTVKVDMLTDIYYSQTAQIFVRFALRAAVFDLQSILSLNVIQCN